MDVTCSSPHKSREVLTRPGCLLHPLIWVAIIRKMRMFINCLVVAAVNLLLIPTSAVGVPLNARSDLTPPEGINRMRSL